MGQYEQMKAHYDSYDDCAPEEEDPSAYAERMEEAYAASAKAIASYRWWGFTSLMMHFRLWVTSVKLRLGMKLWP